MKLGVTFANVFQTSSVKSMKVRTTGIGNIHINPMVKYLLRLKDNYNNVNSRMAKSAQ